MPNINPETGIRYGVIAINNLNPDLDPDDFWDIMYRQDDGTLTTDF